MYLSSRGLLVDDETKVERSIVGSCPIYLSVLYSSFILAIFRLNSSDTNHAVILLSRVTDVVYFHFVRGRFRNASSKTLMGLSFSDFFLVLVRFATFLKSGAVVCLELGNLALISFHVSNSSRVG